jgi:hypothetical protein
MVRNHEWRKHKLELIIRYKFESESDAEYRVAKAYFPVQLRFVTWKQVEDALEADGVDLDTVAVWRYYEFASGTEEGGWRRVNTDDRFVLVGATTRMKLLGVRRNTPFGYGGPRKGGVAVVQQQPPENGALMALIEETEGDLIPPSEDVAMRNARGEPRVRQSVSVGSR